MTSVRSKGVGQADRQRRVHEQANRAYLRDLEATYVRWQRFVAEEQARLTTPTDDDTVDDLTRPPRASSRGSSLSRAEHRELTDIFERRRQQLGYAPDADGSLALLARIRNELQGRDEQGTPLPDGWAVVWYGDGLKQINHQRIVGRMSAADYARTINGRMIALGALAGVVVLCVVIAVVRVLLTSASTGAATATVLVGTHATTPGPLIGAAIGSTALRGHLEFGTPVVLCVDEGLDRPPTTEDTLVLTRTSSIQTYTLHPVSSVHDVDLLVAACRSRPAQPLHAAQLRESRAAQVLTPSVVQSVSVAGPDTDPDHIAPDQMIVTIEVADESLREAFLILADGTRWPVTEQTGTTLHYRVPLTPSRQDAALEHAAPMGPPRVVPIALAAPTSRRALLQEHLTIEEVTARRTTDGLSVTATVLLSGDAPLTLLVNDVTLTTDSGVELPVTWSPPTLEVQHPTSITVQAAYVPEAPLTLVVGGQQFTMSP